MTIPTTPHKKVGANRPKVTKATDSPTRRRAERNGTHGRQRAVPPHDPETAERAALWANPAFQAALEAGRASIARGERKTLEDLDREQPLSPEQIAEADAWLDEYERRLEREAQEAEGRPEATTRETRETRETRG